MRNAAISGSVREQAEARVHRARPVLSGRTDFFRVWQPNRIESMCGLYHVHHCGGPYVKVEGTDQYDMEDIWHRLRSYSLLDAIASRRSRRFARGMNLNGGPLAYNGREAKDPLSHEEEAALAFAACGVTGYAMAELPYHSGNTADAGGGNIMKQFVGRTVPSADALHTVVVFLINDNGTWMLRRPQDFPSSEIAHLVNAARE